MSIFIDETTRVLVQGITGKEGSFWTQHMKEYGTQVVAGVTPGKEGQSVDGIPVFHTVKRALAEHSIDATLLVVPPRFACASVYEALDAGIKKIVVTAEGIPLQDALEIRKMALQQKAVIIGSNSTGVLSTGKCMMGFFPVWLERVYRPGTVGVITRSGSLTNEVTAQVVKAGFGTSTILGVGGDATTFTRFGELLPLFEADQDTNAVVMIGELGGTMEEEVAEAILGGHFKKPLIAFLGGRTAPKGTKMGHAGAIISAGRGSVQDKIDALTAAGAYIAAKPSTVGSLLQQVLHESKIE